MCGGSVSACRYSKRDGSFLSLFARRGAAWKEFDESRMGDFPLRGLDTIRVSRYLVFRSVYLYARCRL